MIGQAQFSYTDQDMIATQRAGWAWHARWRNLLIVFVAIAVFESAILAGLNGYYGTRGDSTDIAFVIVAAVALTILLFGLLYVITSSHARQILRSNRALAWNGDELRGEHVWTWDEDELHMCRERGRADLPWTAVGAWLDAPEVLLLFPSGGRAFHTPERALAAGWRNAPKVFLYPSAGHALALPKRTVAEADVDRLVDVLRTAGARERRRFGLVASKGIGAAHGTARG